MPKYRIEHKEGGGSGGLYELEVAQYWYVIHNETGKVVKQYRGDYFASLEGGLWSNGYFTGVVKVELSEDENEALVYYSGVETPEIETLE